MVEGGGGGVQHFQIIQKKKRVDRAQEQCAVDKFNQSSTQQSLKAESGTFFFQIHINQTSLVFTTPRHEENGSLPEKNPFSTNSVPK